jgi:hypothetical protein
MIYFTEVKSGERIAINPKYVVAVFKVAEEGELMGKTIISLVSGQTAIEESVLDVVGQLQGAN